MKTNSKMIVGFLAVIVLLLSQLAITHKLQGDLYDNSVQIKEVEAPLNVMVEQVIGYDAMLTGRAHIALLHAQEKDYKAVKGYKADYDEVGVKLDNLLQKDARILLNRSKRPQDVKDRVDVILKELDKYNLLLVDLEVRAFAAMEDYNPGAAYSLIVGGDYDNYKQILYQNYRDWSEIESGVTMDLSNRILKESQQIVYLNLGISLGNMILVIITLLIIRSFFEEKYEKYRLLYDSSNDAIMTLRPPDWKFASGNSMAIKMFNCKDEEQFTSLKPDELSPEKQPDGQPSSVKAKEMIDKAMKEGANSFEWAHKRFKGEDFYANVLLSRVKDGGKTYLQATVRDITEHKKMDEKLRKTISANTS